VRKVKDRVKKVGSMDITFFVLVMVLLTFGLIMLFSASYAYAYYRYKGDSFHFIKRQALFAIVGVIGMLIISKIDYHILRKFVFWVFGGAYALLIVVLFMPPINNAHRWISLKVVTFQPSEIMKFAIILLFAHLISINYKRMGTFAYGVLPFLFFLGIVAVVMLLEPHLSGTVLIMSIGLIMMFVGGTKYRYFALALAMVVLGIIAIVMVKGIDYVQVRLAGWLDPFHDTQDDTYQTVQSLLAIGSGGLWGLGLGQSRQKFLYLPEPANDFIFSVVCEELGFIGATIIILLFVMFVYRGFVIASKAPDKFGTMLVVGLTVQIGIQAMLNIAVVSNTIPNTGISLPFFSYGGTALLFQLFQMGIVLNVSRQCAMETQ